MHFIKKITNGKIHNEDDIKLYISTRKDGFYTVEIKKFGDRSPQSNKYYWGWVLKHISEHTGHKPMELHYFFKHKILAKNGEGFPSTKELNDSEFNAYLEEVKNVAASIGIIVPDLNK